MRPVIHQTLRETVTAALPVRLETARVLLVDGQAERRAANARHLRARGAPEPMLAGCADEALEMLAAELQQVDLLVVWEPLPDVQVGDLAGVMRASRSPVRLMVMTDTWPFQHAEPETLAGAGHVEHSIAFHDLVGIGEVGEVLASPNGVGDILDSGRVPEIMPKGWAWQIYGAEPGDLFGQRNRPAHTEVSDADRPAIVVPNRLTEA